MNKKKAKLELWKARVKNFLRGDFLRAKKLTTNAELAYVIAKNYKRDLVFLTQDLKKYKADVSFLQRFKLLPYTDINSQSNNIKDSVVLCDLIEFESKWGLLNELDFESNVVILLVDDKNEKIEFNEKIKNSLIFDGKGLAGERILICDKGIRNVCDNLQRKQLKIQAIVTCYNEVDIIGHTIRYLINQGIYVHIIDNWSTDGSGEIIKDFAEKSNYVTSEVFPSDGPSDTFDWAKILKRVQAVAIQNSDKFDWFIHHDADEIREAPFGKMKNLKEGIEVVDFCGFNTVNHTVINFALVKDGFDGKQDLEQWFEYFEFGEKKNFHHKQLKAWKSNDEIDLVSSGGHIAKFENMKIFPYRFLLKHYPLRSIQQAKRKVFIERKSRWNKEEKQKDWHKQYDNIDQNYNFLKNKKDFIKYDRNFIYNKYLIKIVFGIESE